MKNIFLITIVSALLFGCSPYPKKTYQLYQKEYSGFAYNPTIDSIEKKHTIRLNSLANIEKTGGKLFDELYLKYDSIRKALPEAEWFERENELYYELANVDSLLNKQIFEIAKKQYDNNTGLMLTLGGDGYCGISGKWYDELTLKYGFKYKSILCSDLVFYELNMAKLYNSYAEKYIDSLNGKGWEQKLEDEILEKKRNIKIKTDFISVLKTKEYHIFDRQLLVFPNKVTKLKNLKTLYVTGNQFSEVNEDITKLKKLRKLYLWDNKFSAFPEHLLELNQLEWLYLSNNQITEVPNEISKLEHLINLDLSSNKLSTLPKSLAELKKLETLDITENNFDKIPEVLYEMKNLKILRVGFNNFFWKDNEKIQKQLSLLKKALPNTKIY